MGLCDLCELCGEMFGFIGPLAGRVNRQAIGRIRWRSEAGRCGGEPEISKLLRHTSIAMTERYTHLSRGDLKAAVERKSMLQIGTPTGTGGEVVS